jgi:hypothetical protein
VFSTNAESTSAAPLAATELGQERANAFGPVSELTIDQPADRRQKASAMRWIPSKPAHQLKSPDFIKVHGPSPSPLRPHDKRAKQPRDPASSRADSARHRKYLAPASRHSDMNIAYISALSALAGSVIGGFTQARAERFAHDLGRREELYWDFILEASGAYGEAIVDCALNVMVVTIATYSSPNNSVPELNELLKSGGREIDPLKEFAEAAREELRKHPAYPR